jgi:hypothetical protein
MNKEHPQKVYAPIYDWPKKKHKQRRYPKKKNNKDK